MTLAFVLLGLGLAAFVTIRHALSARRDAELAALEGRLRAAHERYETALARKRDMARQLEDKERQLAAMQNGGEGIRAISLSDIETDETDENEQISRYLLSRGKISLEQSQKAHDKMNTLQMDYLAVCLTLGFIDLETARMAAKMKKSPGGAPR